MSSILQTYATYDSLRNYIFNRIGQSDQYCDWSIRASPIKPIIRENGGAIEQSETMRAQEEYFIRYIIYYTAYICLFFQTNSRMNHILYNFYLSRNYLTVKSAPFS